MVKIWELTERCPGYKKDYPEVIPPFVSVWEEKEDLCGRKRRNQQKGGAGTRAQRGVYLLQEYL